MDVAAWLTMEGLIAPLDILSIGRWSNALISFSIRRLCERLLPLCTLRHHHTRFSFHNVAISLVPLHNADGECVMASIRAGGELPKRKVVRSDTRMAVAERTRSKRVECGG